MAERKQHTATFVSAPERKQGANARQVGGNHYKKQQIEHWDWVAANGLDYFQGNITKYVSRWKDKGGIADLKKAQHYLEKYLELVEAGVIEPVTK